MSDEAQKHWLVRRATIRQLWIWGGVLLALLIIADLFVHGHPVFGIDGMFAFYAWYGLLSCIAMVLFAKVLGTVLKRPEDYHGD
jgi:hypothetical protein